MSAEEEKLEQVKAFSELRTGMLIVAKPCGHCGKPHRGQLLNPNVLGGIDTTIPLCREASCHAASIGVTDDRFEVVQRNVADGIIFRVVDGLEDPAEYELAVLRDAAPKTVLRIRMGMPR